jgi:hypothetical protein
MCLSYIFYNSVSVKAVVNTDDTMLSLSVLTLFSTAGSVLSGDTTDFSGDFLSYISSVCNTAGPCSF